MKKWDELFYKCSNSLCPACTLALHVDSKYHPPASRSLIKSFAIFFRSRNASYCTSYPQREQQHASSSRSPSIQVPQHVQIEMLFSEEHCTSIQFCFTLSCNSVASLKNGFRTGFVFFLQRSLHGKVHTKNCTAQQPGFRGLDRLVHEFGYWCRVCNSTWQLKIIIF